MPFAAPDRIAARMVRFRILVAWLILLALPLQGAAAVSLRMCGPAAHAVDAVHAGHPAGADAGTHRAHSDPAGHAGHAAHAHFGHTSTDTHALAGTGTTGDPVIDASTDHSCAFCAFCGHGLALGTSPPVSRASAPPEQLAAAPLARLAWLSLPVPDKPPRA